MAEKFASFDLGAMSKTDGYKLLASVILPRPIAWVVSRDAEGVLNAAPFSFFNILSADPPLVAIGFSGARGSGHERYAGEYQGEGRVCGEPGAGGVGAGDEYYGDECAAGDG